MLLFQNRLITKEDIQYSPFSESSVNYIITQGNTHCNQYKPIGILEKYCPNGLFGENGLPYEKFTQAHICLLPDIAVSEQQLKKINNASCTVYYCGEGCLAYVFFTDDKETLDKFL